MQARIEYFSHYIIHIIRAHRGTKMSIRRRIKEAEAKLSAAIRPFLKYYDFAATDERLFTLTGMYAEDISDFHPGDVEDGYTFIGHLVARDGEATTPDILLVFEKDSKYTVGCTVGGMVIPINLKDALD